MKCEKWSGKARVKNANQCIYSFLMSYAATITFVA